MKYTITNGQLVAANVALQSEQLAMGITVGEGTDPKKFPLLLAARTRLLGAVNALKGPLATLQSLQEEIVDRYVEKDEQGRAKTGEGGKFIFREGTDEEFQEALRALSHVETEVDVQPLSLKLLGKVLTELPDYGTLNAIHWMLIDDIEEGTG